MNRLFATLGFTLLLSASVVFGQVSDEKLAATKELVAIMNQSTNVDDLVRAMTAQNAAMEKEIIDKIVDDRTDLTPAGREELRQILMKSSDSQSANYTDRILAKLDLAKILNEIMVTLYDKHFTLEEIRELVAFYKTATGQKLLATSQPLMVETMAMTQEKIVPKILEVLDELRAENERDLANKANEAKPKKPRR